MKARSSAIPTRRWWRTWSDLPFAAFDLVSMDYFLRARYSSAFPPATAITSRGCPYHSSAAPSRRPIYDHGFRAQSPERVLEEARLLRRGFWRAGKSATTTGSRWRLNRERVLWICEKFRQAGWAWSGRPSPPGNVDAELARAMKSAGCTSILYGVELRDDEILKKIRKGTTTALIRRGVDAAKAAGIDILNCVMLGFYWDTPETVRRTVEFAFELDAKLTQLFPSPCRCRARCTRVCFLNRGSSARRTGTALTASTASASTSPTSKATRSGRSCRKTSTRLLHPAGLSLDDGAAFAGLTGTISASRCGARGRCSFGRPPEGFTHKGTKGAKKEQRSIVG